MAAVAFDVSADAYGRFMGRYSGPLATEFADLAEVRPGQRALDVGCGPGALTAELVARLGAEKVSAIDPSASFVAAVHDRLPGVAVSLGSAEHLPHEDGAFDVVLAQLVVHFMTDAVGGLTEMARVTRPGGVVAASVWDHAGGRGPLAAFWQAVKELDPTAPDESRMAGVAEGSLASLFEQAGMTGARAGVLTVPVTYPDFDQWWAPYTLGVGPAGDHVARLDSGGREQLRDRCRALLPDPPFTLDAAAWTALWSKPE